MCFKFYIIEYKGEGQQARMGSYRSQQRLEEPEQYAELSQHIEP